MLRALLLFSAFYFSFGTLAWALEGRLFSDRSPWNEPIGEEVVVLSESNGWIDAYKVTRGTINYNLDIWTPYFEEIQGDEEVSPIFFPGWQIKGVPVSDKVREAVRYFEKKRDTDSSLCLYNQRNGLLYNLFGVHEKEGVLSARAAAAFHPEGAGWWDNRLGPWAGRSSGASYCGGLVKPEEYTRGEIRHALAAGWPAALVRSKKVKGAVVLPATTTDGQGNDADRSVPMGTRLQLDPTLTDDALRTMGLTEGDLIIARALQKYGVYIVDSSSVFCLYFASGLGEGRSVYKGLGPSMPVALLDHMYAVEPPKKVALESRLTVDVVLPSKAR